VAKEDTAKFKDIMLHAMTATFILINMYYLHRFGIRHRSKYWFYAKI